MAYIILFFALLLTAAGQLLFKAYFLKKAPIYVLLALASFISVPLLNYFALRELQLDVVYMATALTIVAVLLGSGYFFGERVGSRQWLAAGLIVLGIVVYNL